MRIAVLSTLSNGGAAAAARRITAALALAGHECSLFALETTGGAFLPLANIQEDGGTSFWTQTSFTRWGALSNPQATSQGAELFSDTFVNLHPFAPLPEALLNADAVHMHWMAGMLFSPGLLQAIQGKKVVWTLHDMNAFTGGCHYHPTCRNFETQCAYCPLLVRSGPDDASAKGMNLKRALYPHLDVSVVTPSEWLASEARCSSLLRAQPIFAIPNCIDTGVFKPGDRAALRKSLGIHDDSLVLLLGSENLGNPRKNAHAAVEALRILAGRNPDMRIEMLAFGWDSLPEIPFPVHRLGFVADEALLSDAYSAADLFMHPSILDNLPNTLCEAQCCGTPVISFDAGGCAETMVPGKTGFLVREKTAAALADTLAKIYREKESLRLMRKAARDFAVKRFAQDVVAEAYTRVFDTAPTASGFADDRALQLELSCNQMASLAVCVQESFVRAAGVEKRLQTYAEGIEKHLQTYAESIEKRLFTLDACIAGQEARLCLLSESLRHPLRWLWRKIRKKSPH